MARTRMVINVTTGEQQVVPYTLEEEAAADAIAASLVPTPSNTPLSMRQLRLGLKRFGGKSATFLQGVIDTITDPDGKDEAQIWYDETSTVLWDHPMTQKLVGLAGFTVPEAAAMWMQAKDIAA